MVNKTTRTEKQNKSVPWLRGYTNNSVQPILTN